MSETKPLIVVTYRIPAGLELLKQYNLKVNLQNRALRPSELASFVKGARAILSMLNDRIDEGIFDAAGRQLKIVANYAVGFDNINLLAAKKRRIIVTNAPTEAVTEAVAEQTFALLLAVARRLPESDRFVRTGKHQGWEPELFLGRDLRGKTLGILGLGRIGKRVAEIGANGYQMKVIYYNRGQKDSEINKRLKAEDVTLRKLLTTSDFLSLHIPLTPQTRHLIGKSELESMKKTAILLNTSRGPVVEEKALIWALKNKIIWGAGIDVFEFEPKINPELKRLDNLVMTPHIASATEEGRLAMAVVAVKNILAVLEGKPPLNPVCG